MRNKLSNKHNNSSPSAHTLYQFSEYRHHVWALGVEEDLGFGV